MITNFLRSFYLIHCYITKNYSVFMFDWKIISVKKVLAQGWKLVILDQNTWSINTILLYTIINTILLLSLMLATLDWTVSHKRLPKIFVFRFFVAYFTFFRITSDYLIPCCHRLFPSDTTANFGSYVCNLLHCF